MQRVEYSLDASRWRVVYPKDGIPDSRREEFEVTLEEGEAGRSVIIRATDAMNNVATAVAPNTASDARTLSANARSSQGRAMRIAVVSMRLADLGASA